MREQEKKKTEAVETLHAEIDQLEASLAKLSEDIAELTKAVADLDAAMSKATTIRDDEQTTNTETIADSQAAQTAVARALTVLKEFYAKAGEATAFVQQSDEPEIFDSPYKGMGGESGGVVGMLEADAKGDLTETTTTKEADKKYLADLVATCEQKATDFESRQQLRTEELEAVAKAIEIVSSGAVKGSAEKPLPSSFLEGNAMASLRMDAQSQLRAKAGMFLQQRAHELQL